MSSMAGWRIPLYSTQAQKRNSMNQGLLWRMTLIHRWALANCQRNPSLRAATTDLNSQEEESVQRETGYLGFINERPKRWVEANCLAEEGADLLVLLPRCAKLENKSAPNTLLL